MSKWEWKKLGEVCDSINGLWKGKKEPLIKVGVIRNTNFTKNCKLDLNPSKLEFLDVEKKQYDKRKLQFGDLIVEKSGGSEKQPVGRVVLFEEKEGEYSFSNFTSVLRIKNDDEIECHFLHLQLYKLYLDGVTKQMQSATTGIHNLDFDQFKDLSIGIPPLSEQKRIVKFLDEEFSKIETLKTNAETNLKNARQLFKAGLEKTFQGKNFWKKMLLEDVCSNIVDCPHTTPKKVSYQTNYPCIRTSELKYGEIDWKSMQYLDEKEYKKRIARLEPKENDIVYGREGTFGDAVLLPNTHRFSLGQRTMLFRPDLNFVIPRFLLLSIISPYVYKQAQEKNNGCGVGHVNVGDIKKFNVFIPPLSVQKEIVARLDKLSENVKRLETNYKQIIANCDELKKSILKKTFERES